MGSSDSEAENEEFESAEENLDEGLEENVMVKSKKSLRLSERDVETFDVSNCEVVNSEKRVPSNLSYRKRPERVKRLSSIIHTKSITKSPSTESIFKTNVIAPDVFFQDFTSNLSKNINKSLSTLHQKSTNVKDLILNSLPTSSTNYGEGFSYDVKNIASDEWASTSCEADSQNKQPDEFKNVTKEQSLDSKVSEAIFSVLDKLGGSKKESLGVKSDDTLKNNYNVDLEEKMFCIEVQQSVKTFDNNSQNSSSNLKDSSEKSFEIFNTRCAKAEDNLKNYSDPKSFNKSIDKSNIEEKNSDDNLEIGEISETGGIIFKHEQDEGNTNQQEIVEQGSLENKAGTKLKAAVNDFKIFSEDNTKTDSVCKTEVENILKEEKNMSEIGEDISKIKITTEIIKEECRLKDKSVEEDIKKGGKLSEINKCENYGWEDFDFSDNELEMTDVTQGVKDKVVHEDKIKLDELVKKNIEIKAKPGVEENKLENMTESSISLKNLSEEEQEEEEEEGMNTAIIKENQIKKECNENKEGVQMTGTNPLSDDWDWDNWDETPKSDKENSGFNEELREDNEGKWSGWDTFGQKPQEKHGNWNLGSWGVNVLFNKATAVTLGISSVLEAGLGAPDPKTLAKMEVERLKELGIEEVEIQETVDEISKRNSLTNVNIFPVSGITNLVAGVTSKFVEHSKIQEIGSKVIIGGLDTLETFGKKTMEVLQEGDPGLKNKRALLLGHNKPVLSQVLKEAREKADKDLRKAEEKELAKKCNFETAFDDFQGMVHLEALEMLSTQCELKLNQIRSGVKPEELEDLNGILEEVEQLCALDECDLELNCSVLDFKIQLQNAVEPLKNEISIEKIIDIHVNVNKWLQMSSEVDVSLTVIYQKLVSTLAELAAATVQQFHKSGELLSVKECRKTVEEVDALSKLTVILCTEINRLYDKFVELSHSKRGKENNNENLNFSQEKFSLVMKNSTSYIKQAFDLLIPVIQLGAAV